MAETSLRARLERVADLAGDDITPPPLDVFHAPARRNRIAAVVAAAVVVAGVAVAATLIGNETHHSPVSTSGLPVPDVAPPGGNVTVAQLTRYRWSALPRGPLQERVDGTVAIWTGSRMLVWGGDGYDSATYDDGASYDPVTQRWTMLAPSPLSARADPAFTWTGRELFIWGGSGTSDGAMYDPAKDTWSMLPPLPGAYGDVRSTAVWTGSRVVLFTALGSDSARTVAVHSYDPTSRTWAPLASVHIPQTGLLDLSALVAGHQLYLWMPVQTLDGSLTTGNDGFVYDPSANSWSATDILPVKDPYSVGPASWTGDHILFQPNGVECSCGGYAGVSRGTWADPASGALEELPGWTTDRSAAFEDNGTFAWTGRAVLAVSSQYAAAWDPTTNEWTHLATAPYLPGGVQVWTGEQLLIWGTSDLAFGP